LEYQETMTPLRIAVLGILALAGLPAMAQELGLHEPAVRVYGARTMGVKGLFGVHTWVAVKPRNTMDWTVYEVIGWRLRWTDSALVIRNRAPEHWFHSKGELYAEKRGEGVDELIRRIDKAAQDYPYAKRYTLWPGPNSNTFTAWIARAVPELEVDLPATAIGKDYIGEAMTSTAPSGRGFQFSLRGVFGFAASGVDGVEVNLLGLNFGVSSSGVKLPMVGRIGSPRIHAAMAAEQPANP
jgi:uncharacterized protein DUF3750